MADLEAYLCPKPEDLFGGAVWGEERLWRSGYYQNVIGRVFHAASGLWPNDVAALDAAVPTAPPSPTSNAEDTERLLARFDIEGRCVSEARGPSLYVGDCTLKAWFTNCPVHPKSSRIAGGATRKIVEGGWTQTSVRDVATPFSRE